MILNHDKRYLKTEKAIHNEFYNLLKNNRYSDITIEKLCENAVISKNTFYAHYKNKDELFDSILNNFINELGEKAINIHRLDKVLTVDSFKKDIEIIFDYFRLHREEFFLFYKNDNPINFSRRLVLRSKKFSAQWMQKFLGIPELDEKTLLLLEVFHTGTGIFLKNWVMHPDKISFEESKKLTVLTQLPVLEKIIDILCR